jgi:hypothetical protein
MMAVLRDLVSCEQGLIFLGAFVLSSESSLSFFNNLLSSRFSYQNTVILQFGTNLFLTRSWVLWDGLNSSPFLY